MMLTFMQAQWRGIVAKSPPEGRVPGEKVATFPRRSEIAAFWKITGDLANTTSCDLLRYLLLTGQRATETAAMKWSDIEDGVWTIPGHMAKNGKEHCIPLGPMSLALIEAQPRLAGCDLVFPGRNGVQVAGWSTRVAPVKAALSEPGFGPHALRRTYRTGLAELNVAEPVAEMMINHTRPDLIQRYSKSELWTQRVEAQNRYESYIAGAVH
jgi:integrase